MNEIATLGTKVVNYTLGMAQFVERFGMHPLSASTWSKE